MTAPHDIPTAEDLLDSVAAFLRLQLVPMLKDDDTLRYHTRIAASLVSTVARELRSTSRKSDAHDAVLASVDMRDDTELARAIKSGHVDDRDAAIRLAVRQSVLEKLAVSSPNYLETNPDTDDSS